ncbi:hypothetical protein [Roseateles noduli]|uniref:hypothetical protein n=1 Tax=Roseateles noduli TaxID=2052484 RepID=UPI003D64D9C0
MLSSTAEEEPRSSCDAIDFTQVPITEHLEVVRPHHQFKGVSCRGRPWDLSHLDPFAFRVDPGLGFEVTVVVVFSSHCFTHSLSRDGRARHEIPLDELFDDGREVRVLCEERFELSQRRLPALIRELRSRAIQIAREDPQNFTTSEELEAAGNQPRHYVVFFEVFRDKKRKRRLLLHVQSAYAKELFDHRRRERRRVSILTILKATGLGRKVKA